MNALRALPLVAIVGRANVGKSTLFNRITGKRQALTSREAGMTRDRRFGAADWCGCLFEIVDTGGLESGENPLNPQISAQAKKAIEDSSLVLFVVDGKEGMTAQDQEIAGILRKSNRSVFLLVNKIDSGRREAAASEFHAFGFERMYSVTAEHGTGVDEVLDDLIVELGCTPTTELEEQAATSVVVLGKPNAGKSTFLNLLLGEERLITSEIPGTTRDTIDVEVREGDMLYRFVDTAGIRKKGQTKTVPDKLAVIYARKSLERAEIACVMLDAKEGVTHQDAVIAGYAREAGKAILVLCNKMDLLTAAQRKSLEMEVESNLQFIQYAPRLYISAKTGHNVKSVFPTLERVYKSYTKRVTTGELNAFFDRALKNRYLGSFRGRPIKLKYITQTGIKPPTFVLFTNAARLHFSHLRYLENQLRSNFGFEGATIRVKVRRG